MSISDLLMPRTSNSETDKHRLIVPRNMQIITAKYFGFAFLLYGTVLIFISLIAGADLSAIFIVPIFLGSIIFSFPENYRTRVWLDKGNSQLKIINKSKMQNIDLRSVRSIISRTITYPYGGTKHFVILSKEDSQVELFKEQCAGRGVNWITFSEQLSILCGLPLSKERWIEDFKGKLHQITPKEYTTGKRRNLLILIPALLPFAFSIAFKFDPGRETFFLFGSLTILIGNVLSAIFFIKSKKRITDWAKRKWFLIIINAIIITIMLTFCYVGLSFLLTGARLPAMLR